MSSWGFRVERWELAYSDPFRIARGGNSDTATTVTVDVTHSDGWSGLGEGYPEPYYGETPETMEVVMRLLFNGMNPHGLQPDSGNPRAVMTEIGSRLDEIIRGHGAARCAIDLALWDMLGRVRDLPVSFMLGLDGEIPPTDMTLGLGSVEETVEKARRFGHFPALKVKLGGEMDLEVLEAVRQVYTGELRVDANTAWNPEKADRILPELIRHDVSLIEQPFPPGRLNWLSWLHEGSPIPVVADESAWTSDDLDHLVGVVGGVNVKLAKCGGITPALHMLEKARALGFKTMLGCMEETSVGIAAAVALAPLVDWVDLDGCLLLADDPFYGPVLDTDCHWQLSVQPGLGVSRRA